MAEPPTTSAFCQHEALSKVTLALLTGRWRKKSEYKACNLENGTKIVAVPLWSRK
jgi:hypothetical protein